jgi:transposase
MKRYGLRDDQFARIENLLPGRPGSVGRNSALGNRLFVEAVIWKFCSGAPWRDLPERFGRWKNTHTRFSRWAKSGVWESLFKALANEPTTNTRQSTRALSGPINTAPAREKNGGEEAIGRSRGGLTTKIHVIVDALGNPLAISLTGGQAHDITQAEALLAQVEPEALLGDNGYDCDSFVESLKGRNIKPVIPPNQIAKSNAIATSRSIASATSLKGSSIGSGTTAPSPRVMKRPHETSSPGSSWSAPSLGLNEDTP